jgi:uncharacterized membrane protein
VLHEEQNGLELLRDDFNATREVVSNLATGSPGALKEFTKDTNRGPVRKPRLSYYNLLWIFIMASMLGLALETGYQLIVFGQFNVRNGLVFGPLSPIYGVGACLMTIALHRVWNKNWLIIFFVAMLIGAGFELFSSFFMEYLFGAKCWYYPDTFGSFGGRINLLYSMMWGTLGLLWVKIIAPFFGRVIDRIPFRFHVLLTICMTVFLAIDISCTLLAFHRADERAQGILPSNGIETLCDKVYDDEFMASRFSNIAFLPSPPSRGADTPIETP